VAISDWIYHEESNAPTIFSNFILHKMKPPMNTDKHRAAAPQPKKSHREDTKNRKGFLRVFVANRMRVLPGERTKMLCQIAGCIAPEEAKA